jgi:hypothetical protein
MPTVSGWIAGVADATTAATLERLARLDTHGRCSACISVSRSTTS